MTQKIRILFLSANPWATGRILVNEEASEIFERIQEGPYRDKFELHNHGAVKPIDLQRLLLKYEPQIVHFSGHGSKHHRIILSGTHGRSKTIDPQGLANVLACYSSHVRLVLLNACFTNAQAQSISEVVNYSIGTGKAIGDKAGVAFAGAFYRALGFGRSVREAFESARAELALTKMPRSRGIELFVRNGLEQKDSFPCVDKDRKGEIRMPNHN
jgi:CHAT domain-containing protein